MDPVSGRIPSPTSQEQNDTDFSRSVKKLLKRKCQLEFLRTVKKEKLIQTKILPSITPRLQFTFKNDDLNTRKEQILGNIKRQLLLLSIEEAERDVVSLTERTLLEYEKLQQPNSDETNSREYIERAEKKFEYITKERQRKLNDKLDFHRKSRNVYIVQKQKQEKRVNRMVERREKNRIKSRNYRNRKRGERHDMIKEKVDKIKVENRVVNFSTVDIPNTVYLYLAKGLNFITSYPCDKLDLKYDALEFIRKLSWKHQFKNNRDETPEVNNFGKLRTQSHKHPTTSHPLIDEIKFKLLSHIENLKTEDPTKNLTPGELRCQAWLSKKLRDRNLFITKADKGGAILIFDYKKVVEIIEKELQNESKYTVKKGDLTKSTTALLKSLCSKLVKNKYMDPASNTLITGVTEGNIQHGMKQNPEYKAITPYAYPLFKIHSLTNEQFDNRVIPPFRLVYSMKFGPLYRMEKWVACFLTPLSKDYCGEEYLRDSDHVQSILENINNATAPGSGNNDNILLFTMDVKALYPSISPELAKLALEHALQKKDDMDMNTKIIIWKLVDFSFKNAFIFYHNSSYKPTKGIPTGGSISRQVADIFLKWLLFIKLVDDIDWELVRNWWRFIDDIFGLWKGSVDQFKLFVSDLNNITSPYGITFDKYEIGRSVNFLDMQIYLSETDSRSTKLNTRLFRKPTDAMRFLDRKSFHAPHTFTSIPFSQMLRAEKRNSVKENKDKDTEELIQGFIDAGYGADELLRVSNKIIQNTTLSTRTNGNGNINNKTSQGNLIFSFKYFKECTEMKEFIKSLSSDIKELIGDHRIIFANKKGRNIGDVVLRNRSLCFTDSRKNSQKCSQPNCKMCPRMMIDDKIVVNGEEFKLSQDANCNTENVIYYAECNICKSSNGYIGRTLQRFNNRGSGHRNCFNHSDFEKSALSMHAMMDHQMNCSMDNFKFAILKKTHPLNLHREEYLHIEKGRTLTKGLNRMQVRH